MCLISELETEVFVLVQGLFFKQVRFPKDLIRWYIPVGELLPAPSRSLRSLSLTCAEEVTFMRDALKSLAAAEKESQAEFLSRGIKRGFKSVLDLVQEIFAAK